MVHFLMGCSLCTKRYCKQLVPMGAADSSAGLCSSGCDQWELTPELKVSV